MPTDDDPDERTVEDRLNNGDDRVDAVDPSVTQGLLDGAHRVRERDDPDVRRPRREPPPPELEHAVGDSHRVPQRPTLIYVVASEGVRGAGHLWRAVALRRERRRSGRRAGRLERLCL
ncbi:hypothetical protein ACFQJD_17920 [Haloplanus sp. GCM10025708]|uniref:hypothetical protein n=1 Tax=Haloferacaceae TaxID=1644056 RepID=UPI0036106B38